MVEILVMALHSSEIWRACVHLRASGQPASQRYIHYRSCSFNHAIVVILCLRFSGRPHRFSLFRSCIFSWSRGSGFFSLFLRAGRMPQVVRRFELLVMKTDDDEGNLYCALLRGAVCRAYWHFIS